MDCSPPGSFALEDSPGKNAGVGCHALLQGVLPKSGIEPRSPAWQADSLPAEPPGKPSVKSYRSLKYRLRVHGMAAPSSAEGLGEVRQVDAVVC